MVLLLRAFFYLLFPEILFRNEDMNNFLGGVKTVAGDMLNEINLVRTSEKTRAEFMDKIWAP